MGGTMGAGTGTAAGGVHQQWAHGGAGGGAWAQGGGGAW
jgi:hypothetical protein